MQELEKNGLTEPTSEEQEQTAETATETEETASLDGGEDYAAMADADLLEVKRLVPALDGLGHLGAMPEAVRFGELREMGLSVKEALGALGLLGKGENRGHLRASVPRRVGTDSPRMSYGELAEAKRLFPGMEEREITRLYRRVNA